eukprot:COSAG06_NODE_25722_length_630_cov_0.836158_1_plen_86_part_00
MAVRPDVNSDDIASTDVMCPRDIIRTRNSTVLFYMYVISRDPIGLLYMYVISRDPHKLNLTILVRTRTVLYRGTLEARGDKYATC